MSIWSNLIKIVKKAALKQCQEQCRFLRQNGYSVKTELGLPFLPNRKKDACDAVRDACITNPKLKTLFFKRFQVEYFLYRIHASKDGESFIFENTQSIK